MRTKTNLLVAAVMAAGLGAASAQVYSQNIVGYVNVVLKGGGNYTLVANPLDDGNGNQLTNLVAGLPNKSQILTWNGSGYNTAITKTGGAWPSSVPLVPGAGFFVKNGIAASPDYTNTFVGNVLLQSGQSVTNALATGYNLVGSSLPYAGDLTVDTNLNIGATLPNKSQFLTWNVSGNAYNTAVTKTGGAWPTPVNIGVGEGFFIFAKSATNWVQSLP